MVQSASPLTLILWLLLWTLPLPLLQPLLLCCAAQSYLASCIFHRHQGMKSHADARLSIIIAVQVRSFFADTEPRESL